MNFRMSFFAVSALVVLSLAGCEDVTAKNDVCKVPAKNLVNQVIPQTESTDAATTNSIYDESYQAWRAFDGASTWTQWISDRIFPSTTQTANLAYKFEAPTQIVAYSLRGRYDTLKDRLPKKWKLQASNDASASVDDPIDAPAWSTLDEQSEMVIGEQWISTGITATLRFDICTPGNYSQYRLVFEEVNGSSVVDLIEVELLAPQETSACLDLQNARLSDVVPPMTADEENISVIANSTYSFSYPAWKAFDNASTWTQFISGHNFRPFTEAVELSIDLNEATEIVAYSLKGRFDTLKDRLPKAWTLQGSNDGILWDILDTQEERDLDFWLSTETTTQAQFDLCHSVSYQNYRLVFTEVNGSSVVDLIEVQLLGQ